MTERNTVAQLVAQLNEVVSETHELERSSGRRFDGEEVLEELVCCGALWFRDVAVEVIAGACTESKQKKDILRRSNSRLNVHR